MQTTDIPASLQAALAERSLMVEREVGRGGMSVVYAARDHKHDRLVAVKVLGPAADGTLSAARFAQEVRVVAGLRHPNILPLYDSGMVDGRLYYVMPLIEGGSLRARLERERQLPVPEAIRLGGEIADALAHAHAAGIVHRDVKPENVLLDETRALVTDFGISLALLHRNRMSGAERLTSGEVRVGTVEYMSPEQAAGESSIDGRSDIYSLACVVYEMLAGMSPFAGANPSATLARRFREDSVPLRQLRPDVTEPVDRAIARALSLEPDARFETAGDFAAALRGSVVPPSPGRGGGAPDAARSHRRMRLTAALVAGAAITALALVVRPPSRAPGLDPLRIVVPAMTNETGDSTLDPVGHRATDWVTRELARSSRFEVVTAATAPEAGVVAISPADDAERRRAIAMETKAGTLVTGAYYRDAGRLAFFIEVTNARNGDLLRAIGPVHVPAAQADRGLHQLAQRIAATLDTILAGDAGRVRRETRAGGNR